MGKNIRIGLIKKLAKSAMFIGGFLTGIISIVLPLSVRHIFACMLDRIAILAFRNRTVAKLIIILKKEGEQGVEND